MKKKILLLIRHGETDWNVLGKYTGQTDIPLNPTGEEQARETAKLLESSPPDVIFSSDLIRAFHTAEIISDHLSVPVYKDKRLREIHQGEWEGLHHDKIRSLYEDKWLERKKNPLTAAAPGGETIGDVIERVSEFLNEKSFDSKYRDIAIVAHGIILSLIKIISNDLPVERVWNLIPPNALIESMEL